MSENISLIDVEIKATDALKQLAALNIETSRLREEQKKLDKSTQEGRLEYERYGQQIKANNAEARIYQKEIQSNIKLQNQQEGSLAKLKAELSLNTAAIDKMSKSERNVAKGVELQKSIALTTQELKEEEEALGNNRRSVGDYGKATRNLTKEMSEYVKRLREMKIEGQANSEEYKELTGKVGELKNAINSRIYR